MVLLPALAACASAYVLRSAPCMASSGYWKSRPVSSGDRGREKDMKQLRSEIARAQWDTSFQPLSVSLDRKLEDNQFRSPQFQRKKAYKQVCDLPNRGELGTYEPLTEEQIAAIVP